MDNKSGVLLGLLVGIAVGANWPKIRKYVGPYMDTAGEASAKGLHSLLGLFVSGKERVEDLLAEAQVKKSKTARKTQKATKTQKLVSTQEVTKPKQVKKATKPKKKATAKRPQKQPPESAQVLPPQVTSRV